MLQNGEWQKINRRKLGSPASPDNVWSWCHGVRSVFLLWLGNASLMASGKWCPLLFWPWLHERGPCRKGGDRIDEQKQPFFCTTDGLSRFFWSLIAHFPFSWILKKMTTWTSQDSRCSSTAFGLTKLALHMTQEMPTWYQPLTQSANKRLQKTPGMSTRANLKFSGMVMGWFGSKRWGLPCRFRAWASPRARWKIRCPVWPWVRRPGNQDGSAYWAYGLYSQTMFFFSLSTPQHAPSCGHSILYQAILYKVGWKASAGLYMGVRIS